MLERANLTCAARTYKHTHAHARTPRQLGCPARRRHRSSSSRRRRRASWGSRAGLGDAPRPPPIHLPINPLHLSLTNAPFPTPLRPGWRSSCRPASWRSAPSARPSPTLPPPSPTASPPPAAAPPPTWICGSNLRTHSTLSGSDSKLDRLRKDVTNAPDRVHDHAPLHHPDLRCY